MARAKVRATQLIVAEVVVVAVVAAYTGPRWLFVGVLVGAGGLLLATFGRVDGRWWYEAAIGHRRFARRRARVAADLVNATISGESAAPTLTWLRTIAPELRVRPVSVRGAGGGPVGVGTDEHGWFAVVAVGPSIDASLDPAADPAGGWSPAAGFSATAGLPLAELADLLSSDRGTLSSAQAITRSDGRLGWIAVRLSAVDGVEIERERGLPALDAAVTLGVHRAARMVQGLGYPAQVLDPDGLLAALVESNALDGPPQEHWSTWGSGRSAHTFFVARSWPGGSLPQLAQAAPGVSLAVSVTADGEFGVLVRATAPAGVLGRTSRELTAAATRAGVRLRRLDGEHALGAYACSPSGLATASLDPRGQAGRFAGRFSASLGSTAHRAAPVEQIER